MCPCRLAQGYRTSCGVLGCWHEPRRFLEAPVILVEPMLGWMCYWAFVDGRGSRRAAGRTRRVGAGVPAASGSKSWCRRRGDRLHVRGRLADDGQVDAEQLRARFQRCRDWPGRAKSPPRQATEHMFGIESGMHLARLNESVAAPPPSAVRDDAAGRFRLWSRGSGAAGRQIGSNRCP